MIKELFLYYMYILSKYVEDQRPDVIVLTETWGRSGQANQVGLESISAPPIQNGPISTFGRN